MWTTKITVIWLLIMALTTVLIYTATALPQSYEHNYVRIHVPVIKHTRHHTRTLVKKIPIPVPIPVPLHDDERPPKWFKQGSSSFQDRPKKHREREYDEDFTSFNK